MPSWNLTQPGKLENEPAEPQEQGGRIELSWLDQRVLFSADDLPIHLGREDAAQFIVPDQRVSRLHCRIELRNGSPLLTDLSTYGTWVRFSGSTQNELALRRDECVLAGDGEIALGAPFTDFTAPVISFRLS